MTSRFFLRLRSWPDQDLSSAQVLSLLCNAVLLVNAAVSTPLLLLVLTRVTLTGWIPLYGIYIVFNVAIILVAVLRERVPYRVRAWFAVLMLGGIGCAGLITLGLFAATWVFLPISVIICTLLLGFRPALYLAGMLLLANVTISLGHISGAILWAPTPPTNQDSIEWVIRMLAWIWIAGCGAVPLTVLIRYYADNDWKLREKTEALEESQHEYKSIFENAADCLYRTDNEGTITKISPSSQDLLGYHWEDLIGKKMQDLYVESSERESMIKSLQSDLDGITSFHAKLFDHKGNPQLVSSSVRYWKNAAGEIQGVEGVARNITASRKAEEHLRQSQKMDALGQLTSGVAHDFNNLLAIIMANAEFIARSASGKRAVTMNAQEILSTAEQGAGLVKRLLAFARPDRLEPTLVSVDALIRNLQEVIAITVGERVTLEYSLLADDRAVLVDDSQFQSSMINLVLNSRDAMPDGGLLKITTSNQELSATTAGDEVAQKMVKVSITDSGGGMTVAVRERALDPFFTTKPPGTGHGLGLAMVDQFVRESGGSFTLESAVGEGSTATLLLPEAELITVQEPNPQGQHAVKLNAKRSDENLLSRPHRVLLIEDTEQLLTLIAKKLRSNKFEVVTASDGAAALKILQGANDFDVIVSDIMLPGMVNGIDVCRKMVEKKSDQKVVFITGYSEEVLDESDPMSKYPVLYKPFSLTELLNTVQQSIQGGTSNTSSSDFADTRSSL